VKIACCWISFVNSRKLSYYPIIKFIRRGNGTGRLKSELFRDRVGSRGFVQPLGDVVLSWLYRWTYRSVKKDSGRDHSSRGVRLIRGAPCNADDEGKQTETPRPAKSGRHVVTLNIFTLLESINPYSKLAHVHQLVYRHRLYRLHA
jgi:hypothetical protein